MWQTWVLTACFIAVAIFMTLMAFISPYFKNYLQSRSGFTLNLLWLVTLIVTFGVTAFSTSVCLAKENSKVCLQNVITWFVVIMSIAIIVYTIIADLIYRSKMKKNKNNLV